MCQEHFNAFILPKKTKLQRFQRYIMMTTKKPENFFMFFHTSILEWDTMYDKLCIEPGYLSKRVERNGGKDGIF